MSLVFHPAGMAFLLEGPEMRRELERVGDAIVVATKETLSVPHEPGVRNPPPGPPRMRTGDLRNSVRREDARVLSGHLTVVLVAPAIHSGRYYDQDLRVDGYVFVDLERVSV